MAEPPTPGHRLHELVIETRMALVALRFWDPVFERPVTDQLTVTARPQSRDGPVLRAVPTADGLYAFHARGGPPRSEPYQIEVWDLAGRFLPASFTLALPHPEPGIFPTPSSSPSSLPSPESPGLPLFSAPTRNGGPGVSVIRVQLWNPEARAPAAYAVLEVQEGARLRHGLADHRGCVALLVPCPVVRERPKSEGGTLPLHETLFPVTLRVRSQSPPPAPAARAPVPELRTVLAQPPGLLRPSRDAPPAALWELNLPYSREVTLRTDDLPVLWIRPGPSEPAR